MLWHVQILWCDVRFVNSLSFSHVFLQVLLTFNKYEQAQEMNMQCVWNCWFWWSNMCSWLQAINVPWMLILESPTYAHLAHFFDMYFCIAKHMLEINLNDNKIVYTFNFVAEHFKSSNLFEAIIMFSYVANGLFVFLFLLSSIWKMFSWHFSNKREGPKLFKSIFH
jgi:hypothetical protein